MPASTETRTYTSSAPVIGIAVAGFDGEHALQPDWGYRAWGA